MPSPSTFDVFGLVIHGIGFEEVLRRLELNASHGAQTMLVTANPEILLEARRNPAYWNVLRQADFRLVDSFGLQMVGRFSGAAPVRIPGVELAEHLLQEAVKRNWRVGLIGGGKGVADKAAWDIRKAYPELSVLAEEGGMVARDGSDDEAGAEARFRLTQFAPDLLFVAFGHPKQESWIARNLHELPSVKAAVGIGGTFDYWAGEKQRAPKWMQSVGLEWLHRLIKEPQRWKRIFNAVIVFPIAVLLYRFAGKR